MTKQHFSFSVPPRRIICMVLGNVFAGLGIAIFKMSRLGNDPYSGANMAMAARLMISYPVFQILINLVYFAVELKWGRHFIGIGTIVNAVFLGYFVSFFYWLLGSVIIPTGLVQQLAALAVGLVICSFGLSLYQVSDAGISPYDSLALILHQRFEKLPYFWCRMIFDGSCALICFLAGGIVGIGTLATAFGFGPIIHFFNRYTQKWVA